jgi:hypothetical protein
MCAKRMPAVCPIFLCLALAGVLLLAGCGEKAGKTEAKRGKAVETGAIGKADTVGRADATTGATPWASGDSIAVTVRLNAGSYAVGEPVRMKLVVKNWTEKDLSIEFATAQRFDFVVRKGKEAIWQWAAGRTFAGASGREGLAARDSIVYEAQWDQRLADGTNPGLGAYTIQGILKTAPENVSKRRSFGVVD